MQKKIKNFFRKVTFKDIVFLLIFLMVSFYVYSKFNNQEKIVFVEVTFERNSWEDVPIPPENWKVNDIKINDLVYNSLGEEVAHVVDIKRYPWNGGIRENIYLTLEMNVLYNKKLNQYIYNGSSLLIGQSLELNIGETKFIAEVVDIYQTLEEKHENFQEKSAVIKVLCREYEDWHALSLVGFSLTGVNGETLLETLETEIKPAEVAVETADGRIVIATHPRKKDVILTLKLNKVLCTDQGCYFNRSQALQIGSEFWVDNGESWFGANSSIQSISTSDE